MSIQTQYVCYSYTATSGLSPTFFRSWMPFAKGEGCLRWPVIYSSPANYDGCFVSLSIFCAQLTFGQFASLPEDATQDASSNRQGSDWGMDASCYV